MLPAETLEARLAHLAQSPTLRPQTLDPVTYGKTQFLLPAFRWGDDALPGVYIFAGIHGDEPGGVEAALRLLESLADGARPLARHSLLVLPCLNPSGLAAGTRVNQVGQDINRQFHADFTQESAAIRRFLDLRGAAALVDLHTDAQVEGFYLFEMRQEEMSSLADVILETLLKARYPLEEHPFYAGHVGRHGLFTPTAADLEEHRRTAPGLSLSEWGWMNGVPRCYPMEAPYGESYERSAAMLITALFALFAAMEA